MRKSHAKVSALKLNNTRTTSRSTHIQDLMILKQSKHLKMALINFLFITLLSAQCLGDDNCEKTDLPHAKDEIRMKENYSLRSHLLSEHFSSDYYGCFTRCSVNCHCLSFNFKSDSGVGPNCQLNEAASYTDPESIKPKIGWTYIEMVRSYLAKVPYAFFFLNIYKSKGSRYLKSNHAAASKNC